MIWVSSLLVSVLVVLVWTIVVQTIPSIVSKGLEQRIEYLNNKKLEEIRATLHASYSTVGTSVDFLSAVQPELRSKIIASVEKLWESVLSFNKKYSEITSLDSILLPEEIAHGLKSQDQSLVSQFMQNYQEDFFTGELWEYHREQSLEAERLFVGDRLWLIYSTISGIYGRYGYLVHKSARDGEYLDWRKDEHFRSILLNVLSEDAVRAITEKRVGGLRTAIVYLEAEFLEEGSRVMSGSEGFAEALSDIQAALKQANTKIEQERAV